MGNGYKLYYTGKDGKRNRVGIILDPALKKGVIEVNRESDRLIIVDETRGEEDLGECN